MKGFLAGSVLALLLAGLTMWGYDRFAVSSADRYASRDTIHVEQHDNPRLNQGPPEIPEPAY
ncbi:hypothetical protein [Lutibaculum baratangense]|uniref:Uncharacterized protein n=1 Tax=Lutibaculum baratangense AMV1 TaxID=631454 RepID=V4TEE7_9HYPH|nr:hypothetical protein [Lutibaculum baratangense]ESR24578.1 hypothetical protein N177_2412 [Lutibaculum baratangense AMV1]